MEKNIKEFLSYLEFYDWKKLDQYKMLKQNDEYDKILLQFETLINSESQIKNFDFEVVYSLLKQFEKSSQNIMYFGILKQKINTLLLPHQLTKIVNKIEFEYNKKNITLSECECKIRHKYNIIPKTEFLKKISCNFDGYYDTYIYQCEICEFGWMITVDDVNGAGRYKIWNKKEFPINNKNCR